MSLSPHRTSSTICFQAPSICNLGPILPRGKWKHPEAVDALQSLPIILSKRRSKMIRIARYSTSVAVGFVRGRRSVVGVFRQQHGKRPGRR